MVIQAFQVQLQGKLIPVSIIQMRCSKKTSTRQQDQMGVLPTRLTVEWRNDVSGGSSPFIRKFATTVSFRIQYWKQRNPTNWKSRLVRIRRCGSKILFLFHCPIFSSSNPTQGSKGRNSSCWQCSCPYLGVGFRWHATLDRLSLPGSDKKNIA